MKAKYRIITLLDGVLNVVDSRRMQRQTVEWPGQSGSQSTERASRSRYNQRYIWRQRVFRCQRRDHFRRGLRRENHGKW